MSIEITSKAFEPNGPIPAKHAHDRQNVSPPIHWRGVPKRAKALALIVDDPDAPRPEPFVHWVLYNIPGSTKGIPENIPHEARPSTIAGAVQGRNSLDEIGYAGPEPPPGHGTHHYHFHLYALDQPVGTSGMLDKKSLLAAMAGHIVAEGDLVGTYER